MEAQKQAKRKPVAPYVPANYSAYDVRSIQALAAGVASEGQQRHALQYIVNVLCGAYDLPYYPDDRDTAFACGKMFVGKQIVKMTKIIPENIKQPKE